MIVMSDEIKQKANSWMNIAFRTFITIGMAILLKSVPIFIYDVSAWKTDVESRTISTVEMRIDLERHMQIWTLERQALAFSRLSDTEKAIKDLKKSDSLSAIDRAKMREILKKIELNTRK